MNLLTVFKFKTPEGAEQTAEKMVGLQKQGMIEDAAIVSWSQGKKKPQTHKAVNLVGSDALDGAFWKLLFGVLFTASILRGMTVGAVSETLADYGVDDNFIGDVKNKVTEGTSALFLLTENITPDEISEALVASDTELRNMQLQQFILCQQRLKKQRVLG